MRHVSICFRFSSKCLWKKKVFKRHSCHLHTKSLIPPSNFLHAEKNFFLDWKCALICISDWNSISYFQNMGSNSNQINEFCILCDCFQYNGSKVLIRFGFYEHTSPKDFSRIEMRTVRLSTMPNKAKSV